MAAYDNQTQHVSVAGLHNHLSQYKPYTAHLNHPDTNTSAGLGLSPSLYPKSGPPLGSILSQGRTTDQIYTPNRTLPSYPSAKYIDDPRIMYPPPQIPATLPPPVILTQSQPSIQAKVDEARFRADYRVKFGILREEYGANIDIPEPKETQSIDEIKAMYDSYVKKIHLDISVQNNRIYLFITWLIIQLVGTRWFKLPMQGFIQSQHRSMKKYNMLLIELGEQSYGNGLTDGWPVEIRIIFLSLVSAGIFVGVQMAITRMPMMGNIVNEEQLQSIAEYYLSGGQQNNQTDALRRAAEANSDNPAPPPVNVDDNPAIPNIASGIADMFGGGGGNGMMNMLSSFLGGMGNNQSNQQEAPRRRRPTTFGNSLRRQDSPAVVESE